MRFVTYLSISGVLLTIARGQAIVEYSAIAAATSAAGASGAKDAGKSISGVFQSLNETLGKAGKTENTPSQPSTVSNASTSSQAKPWTKPAPVRKSIDPSAIKEGLTRAELIERVGQPMLSLYDKSGSQLVEKMWYPATRSSQIEVRLIDGKVASVLLPAGQQQAQK